MKVYVSGRIKDYPEYLDHFGRECARLQDLGYQTVNPCELGQPDFSYEDFMKVDLTALLACDSIYMLEGWERSTGAREEHRMAAICGMPVYYEKPGALKERSK
jgi:hypothetical protein